MQIRLLAPGDEAMLAQLARDDAAFDLADRGSPQLPLDEADAHEYLTDPAVLHWVALEEDGLVVGHLLCHVQRRRSGAAQELLLYEIGVRDTHRRRGVGTALADAMARWMGYRGIRDVWVLGDNADAVAFYEACGFTRDDVQPTQLSRRV
jgi:aminoglycoside 3-N-acetyltransferase I